MMGSTLDLGDMRVARDVYVVPRTAVIASGNQCFQWPEKSFAEVGKPNAIQTIDYPSPNRDIKPIEETDPEIHRPSKVWLYFRKLVGNYVLKRFAKSSFVKGDQELSASSGRESLLSFFIVEPLQSKEGPVLLQQVQ